MNRWLVERPIPFIIGHRGASYAAPENTAAAFHLALEEGADGIELDVHVTADRVPVVIHDPTLERTTGSRGRISEMRAAELGHLDAGSGEPIPTLESVFATFGRRLLYNVEIKAFRWREAGVERSIARLIAAYDLAEFVTISSFNPITMRRARRVMPAGVLLAQLRYRGLNRYSYLLFSGDADHPHRSMVDSAYVAWARDHRYRIHVWTVDDPDEARRLTNLGVHAIITNKPAAIRQAIEP